MLAILDNLPENLTKLYCSRNKITKLDNLPLGIKEFDLSSNEVTNLDYLPNSIKILNCSHNKIKSFDNLPNSIEEINLTFNTKCHEEIYMDILPKNLKKNFYYQYNNNNIPILNINLSKWNIKNSLIDGNYLQKKSIDDNITSFSPTEYDAKCDFLCDCIGFYNPQWGYKNCRALLKCNSRCDCSNSNCLICYK